MMMINHGRQCFKLCLASFLLYCFLILTAPQTAAAAGKWAAGHRILLQNSSSAEGNNITVAELGRNSSIYSSYNASSSSSSPSLLPVQYRRCYSPPTHQILRTNMSFNLRPDNTTVTSLIILTPNPQWREWRASDAAAALAAANCSAPAAPPDSSNRTNVGGGFGPPLVLNGRQLVLHDIQLDGRPLPRSAFTVSPTNLTLLQPPDRQFSLKITTSISPINNRPGNEGVFMSPLGTFSTQCEALGFSRITYYLDRPDVLSVFTVRLEADAAACPVLLSNGNLKASGQLLGGRHFAVWEDPWPKPSYLFALVAGHLALSERSYTSSISGKTTRLCVYVPPAHAGQAVYALQSLKQVMAWDEAMFGREYDLDVCHMVGIDRWYIDAMENKGLALFRLNLLAADPQTHTDTEAAANRDLVAHEYLHNWSGNRVTVRDWFQLALKEGLTVLRVQLFAADLDTAVAAAAPGVLDSAVEAYAGGVGAAAGTAARLRSNGSSNSSSTSGFENPDMYDGMGEPGDDSVASGLRRLTVITAQNNTPFSTAQQYAPATPAASTSSSRPAGAPSQALSARIQQLLLRTTPSSPAAAVSGSSWQRVLDAKRMRTLQFPEAAGYYAKPVRPVSYQVPNRELYTETIYKKGAEVFRLYHTVLGPVGLARALEVFFDEHDGEAATFEDFHAAVAVDNPGAELSRLLLWLNDVATPYLSISSNFDTDSRTLEVSITQDRWGWDDYADDETEPLFIPLKVGVLDSDGNDIPFIVNASSNTSLAGRPLLVSANTTATIASNASASPNSSSALGDSHSLVLLVSELSQTFTFQFDAATELGAVSWLRDFSAPVILGLSNAEDVDDLALLAGSDSNPFARWDASQRLMRELLVALYEEADEAGEANTVWSDRQLAALAAYANHSTTEDDYAGSDEISETPPAEMLEAVQQAMEAVLLDGDLDGQYKALFLELPSMPQLIRDIDYVKPAVLHQVHSWVVRQLAQQLQPQLQAAVAQADAVLAELRQPVPAAAVVAQAPAAASAPTAPATAAAATPAASATTPPISPAGHRRLAAAPAAVTTAASSNASSTMPPAAAAAGANASSGGVTAAAAADVFAPVAVKARAVKNAALLMLSSLGNETLQQQMQERYYTANCLTDRLVALKGLEGTPAQAAALTHFYTMNTNNSMALLKWLKLQASSNQPGNVVNVRRLMSHPRVNMTSYDQCYALLYSFSDSAVNFHALDGSGYEFMVDAILQVDPVNPYCASRLVSPLRRWQGLEQQHRKLVCRALARLVAARARLQPDTADSARYAAEDCSQE